MDDVKSKLLALLKKNSVSYGDFTLSSGAKSKFYIDCRLTTLNPEGAALVGEAVWAAAADEAARQKIHIDGIGGLTMGADPVALAAGLAAYRRSPSDFPQVFTVRKAAKGHGQTRLIEGPFKSGDRVVVVEDVVTTGESALRAMDAVKEAGGVVAFIVALVDREEGGRARIEATGVKMTALFTKRDLIDARHLAP